MSRNFCRKVMSRSTTRTRGGNGSSGCISGGKNWPVQTRMNNSTASHLQTGFEIAIIGMAGRFPGAASLEKFWHNLRNGVESVAVFSDEELEASGVDRALLSDPNYVKSGAVV